MRETPVVPRAELRTYYDRPVLKEPVWRWFVPAYFFTGGLAAGSSLLAFGGELSHRGGLAGRARLTSVAALSASAALLVADLGRPERFHHMLRVAKPTSPMSVGSWLLAGFGPAAGLSAACGAFGVAPGVRRASGAAAAVLAPAVATYTGVLVADTAVPAWTGAATELPLLFAGGAAASGGAAAIALAPGEAAGPAGRLLLVGAALELGVARIMERRLGDLAAVYRAGTPQRLRRLATACTVSGAALVALPGRSRRRAARCGAALTLTGAVLERFTVFAAGVASARDPRQTVGPER